MSLVAHPIATQRKQLRKGRRLERLMNSGVLTSYSQKVKVAYHYIDLDNKGYMTLKDLSDRGSFVFTYLCIDEELNSSFTFLVESTVCCNNMDLTSVGRFSST